jgi:hypothetical protein
LRLVRRNVAVPGNLHTGRPLIDIIPPGLREQRHLEYYIV